MKTGNMKFAMSRLPAIVALALLASCGGGSGGGDIGANIGADAAAPPAAPANATGAAPPSTPDTSTNTSTPAVPNSSLGTFVATLSGAQETPPNAVTFTGNATAAVDMAKTMTVEVSASGIAGTVAHVHQGATGVAGPIVFPLTETPPGSGEWSTVVTLTDAQLNTLRAGNFYVNVHTKEFPNGAIRGQLLPPQPSTVADD